MKLPSFQADPRSFATHRYERQCAGQEQWPIKTRCPPEERLLDNLNLWLPLDRVDDYPLAFLDRAEVCACSCTQFS